MVIKAWVTPPVSLSLKEIQNEFGCVPAPPTTTTTNPPQTSTTTSTSTTSTSTTSTTTLPANTYNPSVFIQGSVTTNTPPNSNTYVIAGFTKGPNITFNIAGGPPGATFSAAILFADSTTASISGTVLPDGTWSSPQDSSANWTLGVLTVTFTFTPANTVPAQIVQYNNTRILQVTVLAATTTSTTSTSTSTTTSTTTTAAPLVTVYSISFRNNTNNAVISSANEGDTILIQLTTSNVPNSTSIPYVITGLAPEDFAGTPSLSGNFVVGSAMSVTLSLADDLITEGAETLTIKLGISPNFLGTYSLTVNDTSGTQSGTAYATSSTYGVELIDTATGGPVRLPKAPVRLMMRLIGAGGSGGGADGDSGSLIRRGGSGLGGTVVLGMIDLPATTETKTLTAAIGTGGLSASGRYAPTGYSVAFGEGGQGFSVTSPDASAFDASGSSGRGGNGALNGSYRWSGHGGGGGGSTLLSYGTTGSIFQIASAAGGGGGGGGNLGYTGGMAYAYAGPPVNQGTIANMRGQDAVQLSNDGGGGGGGGGGAGIAGVGGADNSTNSTGGQSGRSVQNTNLTATWRHFAVFEPQGSGRDKLYRITNNAWVPFLNNFGILANQVTADNLFSDIYFPASGTYTYDLCGDNTAELFVQIDPSNPNLTSVSGQIVDAWKTGPVSGTFVLTNAGYRKIKIIGINYGGPAGIAARIKAPNGQTIWTTLNMLNHVSNAVPDAISGNRNYYGHGGHGAQDANQYSVQGTPGAVAVYWTTNLNEALDVAKLPVLPLPTFQLQLPSGDIANNRFIMYWKGTTNTGTGWSNFQYNELSTLFEFKYEAPDDPSLLVSDGIDYNFSRNTWHSWSTLNAVYSSVQFDWTAPGSINVTISIRRKSDQVVQVSSTILLSNAVSDPGGDISDIRLKSNIVRIGTHDSGIGIYEYDIFNRREIGLMAQEVLNVKPEAVIEGSDGYFRVNYHIMNFKRIVLKDK